MRLISHRVEVQRRGLLARLGPWQVTMTRSPNRHSGQPLRRGQVTAASADDRGTREQAAKVPTPADLDERLTREFVQGLVQSALTRGVDPAARLQRLLALQETTIAMSQDPAVAEAAERLIRAIEAVLRELTAVKS
jgi:hypothetical protein